MSRNSGCWYSKVCVADHCGEFCTRYAEMSVLMEESGIPEAKQMPVALYPEQCDIEAFTELKGIKDDIFNFVNSGKNLYIYSDRTGNGKTSWAIKLMLKYFDCVWAGNGFKCRGIFIHVPTFLNQLKNFNDVDTRVEKLKKLLPDVDLVIWDDVASTDLSGYDHGQLLSYIDTRTLNMKSNIFTGNRGAKDIEKALGTRLASRVWNSSVKIELKGHDNR